MDVDTCVMWTSREQCDVLDVDSDEMKDAVNSTQQTPVDASCSRESHLNGSAQRVSIDNIDELVISRNLHYLEPVMLNEAKTPRPRPISGGWGQGQK